MIAENLAMKLLFVTLLCCILGTVSLAKNCDPSRLLDCSLPDLNQNLPTNEEEYKKQCE